MKEMEDKIREQIRNSEISKKSEEGELRKTHSRNITMGEDEDKRNSYYGSRASANNQKLMSQINQKIDALGNKFQALEEKVKRIGESGGSGNQGANSTEVAEKINQIKPELIKIWAKCDSLDDKAIYAEKKME